jgi:hypothetical protein
MGEALVTCFGKAFGPEIIEHLSAALTSDLTGAVGRDGIDDNDLSEERVGTSEAVGQDTTIPLPLKVIYAIIDYQASKADATQKLRGQQ